MSRKLREDPLQDIADFIVSYIWAMYIKPYVGIHVFNETKRFFLFYLEGIQTQIANLSSDNKEQLIKLVYSNFNISSAKGAPNLDKALLTDFGLSSKNKTLG